jgi:hypothetical protein
MNLGYKVNDYNQKLFQSNPILYIHPLAYTSYIVHKIYIFADC